MPQKNGRGGQHPRRKRYKLGSIPNFIPVLANALQRDLDPDPKYGVGGKGKVTIKKENERVCRSLQFYNCG